MTLGFWLNRLLQARWFGGPLFWHEGQEYATKTGEPVRDSRVRVVLLRVSWSGCADEFSYADHLKREIERGDRSGLTSVQIHPLTEYGPGPGPSRAEPPMEAA